MLVQESCAEAIDRAVRQLHQDLRSSVLGHQEALDELAEVWDECRNPGWDGHGALAVGRETLTGTYTIIDSLPLGFPRPAIGAEPDGQLTLEWHKSPTRILSVSVDPDGFLHYAGLFGQDRRYGKMTFFSSAPEELIRLVQAL